MSASSSSSVGSASVEQRVLHYLSTAAEEAIPYERLKREVNLNTSGGEGVIRQLMEQNRVRLRRGTNGDNQIYISIVNNINESYSLVLEAIRASGESGIDQAQLLNKVRMPKTELGKALTALTSKNLIKEHRSFTNRAKRIYTLFHIDPSAHVTGGTMYCGEDLDVAYVDEWRRELARFISTRRMVGFDQIKRHVEAVQSAGGSHGATAALLMGSSSSSSNNAGGAGGMAGHASNNSPVTPPVVTMIESGYARSTAAPSSSASSAITGVSGVSGGGNSSTGGFSGTTAASAVSANFVSKQLSEADLRTLVQTLVLDGVVEMVIPDIREEVSAPQYRIACGQSVMRHFTVQEKMRRLDSSGLESPPRLRARREEAAVSAYAVGKSGSNTSASMMAGGADAAAAAFGSSRRGTMSLPDIEHDGIVGVVDALRQASQWEPAVVSQPSAQEAVDGWAYMPAIGFPCLGCPQLERCSVSGRGVVSAKNCAYLKDWLS